jgi:chorismate synthase
MIETIEKVRHEKDSIGGAATFIVRHLPAGLGEPVFDRLKADLAKAIMSIPAVTAFEVGSGIRAASMKGSQHNDPFICTEGEVHTSTNNHGGMLGGISTGMPIVIRATVKPTSSIATEQDTLNTRLEPVKLVTKGRHDPCLLPRFVPVGEAMILLCLADHFLRWQSSENVL